VTIQFPDIQNMQAIKDLIEHDAPTHGPDYVFENQNLSMKSTSSNSDEGMVYFMPMMTLSARLPGLVPQVEELMRGPMIGD
jgi:hypothetical protein